MKQSNTASLTLIPDERIANKIYLIRDIKVMLDQDLAELYGVETKYLKRQVRRNMERFPEHFMFELSSDEQDALRRQIGTLKRGEHVKYLSFAFTEQGVAMLSSVLKSKRAIQVSIQIIDTFTKLRAILSSNEAMQRKIQEMDGQIQSIYKLLAHLLEEEAKPKREIGFQTK